MLRQSTAGLLSLGIAVFAMGAIGLSRDTDIDLALVLAVDASGSMEPDEGRLQLQGYVEAFRSPHVHRAIHSSVHGRIAVLYFEWSGPSDQWVVMPWSLIETPEDAMAFAEQLERKPLPYSFGGTSISGAIDFSVAQFDALPFTALRQVIDISGNGISSHGRPITQARDAALSRGITINGLPIMLKGSRETLSGGDLSEYYRNCVIGGRGAFIVPVRDHQHMNNAIRTKIVMEIANASPQPLIEKAAASPRPNCHMDPPKRRPK